MEQHSSTGTGDFTSTLEKVHEYFKILIEGQSSSSDNPKRSNVTIRMIPDTLRNLNPNAYTPQIVSIGPLHKEDQRLRPMEEYKVSYMCQLFGRSKNANTTSFRCIQAILGLVKRVRACYVPSLTNYDDSALAKMMVIDGCFILELLYKFKCKIVKGDPILDNILVKHDIKSDLLLLENQIPFFILESLFDITLKRVLNDSSLTDSLTDLLSNYLEDMNMINQSNFKQTDKKVEDSLILPSQRKFKQKDANILGFFHSCYRPSSPLPSFQANFEQTDKEVEDSLSLPSQRKIKQKGAEEHGHILGFFHSRYKPEPRPSGPFPTRTYSATKLSVAGVKLVKTDEPLLAVKFTHSAFCFGTLVECLAGKRWLELPVLRIQNSTPILLRNLIAYEQCYPLESHYITSFAFLMDRLIDTTDDVSLLVKSKVFQHNLGAEEDVKNLFNNICNGIVLRDFYYAEEWGKLEAYCRQRWPKRMLSMIGLYESTTWKTWTAIVAAVIFILTIIQTFFTVRSS